MKPIPVPLENPAATATPRDAGMAAKMRERDAAAAALGGAESTTDPVPNTPESMYAAEQLRGMLAEAGAPTGRQIKHQNPSVQIHDVTAENRVANIARHLKEKGITPADLETLNWDAEGAAALANGPPELTINPGTGKRVIRYKPIDRNGASVHKIKRTLFPEIYDTQNMNDFIPVAPPQPKGGKK